MKKPLLPPPLPPYEPTDSFLLCPQTTNREREEAWERWRREKLRYDDRMRMYEHSEREAQRAVLHARAQMRLRRRR